MTPDEMTDVNIDYIIGELKDSNHRQLSDWEKNEFIPSIADQWERKRYLTERQKEVLGKIWDKIT
jgi:hypothetical protein